MASTKTSGSDLANKAAETVGSTLGAIAGTIDKLRADHPHPVAEAREAIAEGQEQVAQLVTGAGDRTKAIVKAARVRLARARKTLKPNTKTKTAKPTKPTGRKQAKRIVREAKSAARKSVKRGRKMIGRATKAAARSRRRARR